MSPQYKPGPPSGLEFDFEWRITLFTLILLPMMISLGFWQLQRLEWKEAILADIDARIAAAPVALPLSVSSADDNYRGVAVRATPTGEELHVLVSGTAAGTGFRVISKMEMRPGVNIMVDLGLLPIEDKNALPSAFETDIIGNLIWPDDKNSSTPEPDIAANTWFARDVTAMSQHLGTLPIMIVARSSSVQDPRVTPLPINSANIKCKTKVVLFAFCEIHIM